MSCPTCGGDRVTFAVPSTLRPYAPEEAAAATLCTGCLRVSPAEHTTDAPVDVAWGPFPTGDAGVATALLLGLLDSIALRRPAVTELCAHAERAGGDPFLALDRLTDLAETGTIEPHVDLSRRAAQLQSLLD